MRGFVGNAWCVAVGLAIVTIVVSAQSTGFSDRLIICSDCDGAISAVAADMDTDGDLDVLTCSWADNTISWFENIGEDFGPKQIISGFVVWPWSVIGADLDGDGDNDVISASSFDNKISWYENSDFRGNFGNQRLVSSNTVGARAIRAADIDGDGDLDIVSASYVGDFVGHLNGVDMVAWYPNENGVFATRHVITTSAAGARSVDVADIDSDGDLDVIFASSIDNTVGWARNENRASRFSGQIIRISNDMPGASYVRAADVNGDGAMDIVASAADAGKVVWFRNLDGLGSFAGQWVISTNAVGVWSVAVGDIDGDGDIDVASTAEGVDKVAWYENTNGLGQFSDEQIVWQAAAGQVVGKLSIEIADLDGDGDNDLLTTSSVDGKVSYYKNRRINPGTTTGAVGPSTTNGNIDVDASSDEGWSTTERNSIIIVSVVAGLAVICAICLSILVIRQLCGPPSEVKYWDQGYYEDPYGHAVQGRNDTFYDPYAYDYDYDGGAGGGGGGGHHHKVLNDTWSSSGFGPAPHEMAMTEGEWGDPYAPPPLMGHDPYGAPAPGYFAPQHYAEPVTVVHHHHGRGGRKGKKTSKKSHRHHGQNVVSGHGRRGTTQTHKVVTPEGVYHVHVHLEN